jgi:hypothetical protein
MAQRRTLRGGHCGHRADLDDHHVVSFLIGNRHIAPAKALEIWQAWMRTQ